MKPTFLFSVFLIFGTGIFAQERPIIFGVEAGPGVAMIYGNSEKELFKLQLAVYAGTYMQIPVSKIWSMKLGAGFEQKGCRLEIDKFPIHGTGSYEFDYLTIPLRLQAEFGKTFRFYTNAGAFVSYLISKSYDFKSKPDSYLHIDIQSTDENALDYGFAAEIGLKIKLKNRFGFTYGIADHFGMCDTRKLPVYFDDMYRAFFNDRTSKNHSVLLIVGVCF